MGLLNSFEKLTELKYKVSFAMVYTFVYVFLALVNAGGEPGGPFVFFAPIIAWPLLFIAIALLGRLVGSGKVFFVGIMLLYYGLTFYFLDKFSAHFDFEEARVSQIWAVDRRMILFTIAWYFAGQFWIWFLFLIEINKLKRNATFEC